MKLGEIAEKMGLRDLTPGVRDAKGAELAKGYASDLLSDVLANAPSGGVLVTVQVHMNVIAVALHAGLVGVIFVNDRVPEEAVIKKAAEENIQLYVTGESAFDVVGRMHALGVKGGRG
jgi:hypothetical protein